MTTRQAAAIATFAAITIAGYSALFYHQHKYSGAVVGSGDFSGGTVIHFSIASLVVPAVLGILAAIFVLLLWRK